MKTERCDWVSVTSEERWGLKMNPIGKGSLSFASCPREIYAELGAHARHGVRRRTQHTTHVRNSKGAGETFHYNGPELILVQTRGNDPSITLQNV